MSLSNLTLSLFDIFGYLLPGLVVLCAASILESSLLDTNVLNLTVDAKFLIAASVAAYFLGHLCHSLAEGIYQIVKKIFRFSEDQLSEGLYRRVRTVEEEVYGVKITSNEKGAHRRDVYLMADAYLTAAGNVKERDSLLAREGFAKTSTAAFTILAIALAVSLVGGGASLNFIGPVKHSLSAGATIMLTLLSLLAATLFLLRFIFFKRLKINNTEVLFLAHVHQNRDRTEKNKNG